MMQTVLDVLADFGAGATHFLWLPVLAWTGLALPLWAFLNWTDWLHPNAEYRLSQVLLAALPIGVGAVGIVAVLPNASSPTMLPAQSVVVLPAIGTMPQAAPAASWSWTHAAGFFTLGALSVGLFHLGRLALEIVAVTNIRRRLTAAPSPPLQAELDRLRGQIRVRRPVQVRASSDVAVPVTLGGLRPTILVPDALTNATTALTLTLRHELVHIRRWDDLAQLAERLIAALLAVHPLVGRLRRQIAAARERACDAAVLDDRDLCAGDYARLLTTFAEGGSPHRIGALSLSESPSSLIDRLSAMHSSMPSLLSSRLALGTTAIAIGLVLTLGVVACSDTAGPSLSGNVEGPTAAAQSGLSYNDVDTPPELVGGMPAVQESITYPEMAKEAGIEGRVIVQFVVDEKGNVTAPTVQRGAHELLNEAALDAVKPQSFTPGKKEGEPVPVQMSLPVTFRLDDGSSRESDASGGHLFEKAGIQLVRVLMNEEGDLLLGDERVEISNLADAVRQHITKDAARVALLHADGAPTDRIADAKARLSGLNLQKVYVQKVK